MISFMLIVNLNLNEMFNWQYNDVEVYEMKFDSFFRYLKTLYIKKFIIIKIIIIIFYINNFSTFIEF
jgi:hypothetical protein